MAKQKKSEKDGKLLTIRIGITAILAVCFVLVFVFCGGLDVMLGKVGQVKCFAANEFEVHFIDVGQGDCTFIRFPDNTNMLIDAGPSTNGSNLCEYLDDLFLQENIKEIDCFVLTHQDRDHVGAADSIFEKFQVNCLYRPKVYCNYEVENFITLQNYEISTSTFYDEAIVAAYAEPNCNIRFSAAGINWGNEKYNVKFLSPNEDVYKNDSNSYSPIIKITYLDKSFLFTGDAEKKIEDEVIALTPDELKADVLKVAHHGGSKGTSENFLQHVSPSVAVVSVGKNNGYGHPSADTLERLYNCNCKILTTSQEGSIAMSVDSKNNIVKGGKNNSPAVNLALIISAFIIFLALLWGIKFDKQKHKKTRKTKVKSNSK